MEAFSLIGLLLGAAAILVGQHLEGGHWETLVNIPALIIVLGGTLGAVMVETPRAAFHHALHLISWLFFPPKRARRQTVNTIVEWSIIARKEGFLGLENLLERKIDPFAKKGLQMLVDGHDAQMIREVLSNDIEQKETKDIMAAHVYESMGGYCPTIGILGAVLGLIGVLGNLTQPEQLGSGIAVAFVATIYGVGFANLLFIPLSKRLKNIALQQALYREMILEGVVSIAQGENPRYIETKLHSYLELS